MWRVAWPALIESTRLILEAADVSVCRDDEDKDELIPPTVDVEEGIYLNGIADDGHEPFILAPNHQDGFCKTMEKPYDVVVACIILRAYMLAPTNVEVR